MDTSYAYGVSYIRSLENSLLTNRQIDSLISSNDINSISELLSNFGYTFPEGKEDYEASFRFEEEKAFSDLEHSLGKSVYSSLVTAQNDYENLKCALKSVIVSKDDVSYIRPTCLDTESLKEIITKKNFDFLKKRFVLPLTEGYECAVSISDAQAADCIIDKYHMEFLLDTAKEINSPLIKKYIEFKVNSHLIKAAYRFAGINKDYDFIKAALTDTQSLKSDLLALYASKGTQSLLSYLKEGEFSSLCEILSQDTGKYEKYCEDYLTEILKEAKSSSFGAEPVFAYTMAKFTEVRNLRILFTCKKMGLKEDEIKERMRGLYV